MTTNPSSIIDKFPMKNMQYVIVLICFFMNILDGMDVMVISYAAPMIAKDWQISPQKLGMVFSAGLIGMAFGSVFIAPMADKIGRKTILLLCSSLMAISIFCTSLVFGIIPLIILRFLSGLGIGGMLASTTALTAEFTPHKSKNFWVSFVIAGFASGAVLSGLLAARVIPIYGWQFMFQLAGFITFTAVPLIYFFIYDSISYFLSIQPKNALLKVNNVLTKLGQNTIEKLPQKAEKLPPASILSLMKPEFKIPTFQLWAAMFMALTNLYFLTSWIPKLASSAGLSEELSIYSGTVFNVGALLGIITQGYFSSKFGLKKTIAALMVFTAILMLAFGQFYGSNLIILIFGLLGFGIQGGYVGLYAVAARMYPTEFRTTGVGFAIGIGRLGGIIGPLLGGVLIGAGLNMTQNFLVFAVPTFLAGVITLYLSSKEVE